MPMLALSGPLPDSPDWPAASGTKPNATLFVPSGSVMEPPARRVVHAESA
jgi:hypothetical protein